MSTVKSLSQRNVDEIKQVFTEFGIDIPDEATKKELLVELGRLGIDNKKLKEFESKKENKLDVKEYADQENPEVEGDVVVCMKRNNTVFSWGTYRFTSTHKFVPMPKDEALKLIQAYPGFHIATRKEIQSYYK
ncbi:hypothetical protein SEA_NICEHOUSE_62 [Rhodococcus phage NiceHouse]|nr:hypothetical protein SEA_NICEHOUSE_62 [Rhodococcus phage NiceHouse]